MKRRVVITGIGVISPNGIGKENFWNALKEGKSGIKKITSFDTSDLPVKIAGEVTDFRPEDYIEDKKKIKRMARFSQFAVACAKMAVEDSKLDLKGIPPGRIKLCLGVSTSAMDLIESQHKIFLKRGYKGILPFGIFAANPNKGYEEILNEFNQKSDGFTISTSCTSGIIAVGMGFKFIQEGKYDVVLAGGVDTPITPLIMGGLSISKMVSLSDSPEKASRPFDKLRDGGVLSEGAGFLILEELNFAILRGANIYCEILGFGESNELSENMPGSGLKESMENALKNSSLNPKEIDYISAHGASDPILDYTETYAIKRVFGENAYRIPISSIKSMIGNPLGAGGVLQIVSAIMPLTQKIIPPTINYEFFDPLCDLDYVPNKARKGEAKYCLINSHGLGGNNFSLIIKKYEDK